MEPQDRTGRTEISGGQLPTLPQPHHTSAPAGLEGIHSRGDPQPATQPSLSRETGKEEYTVEGRATSRHCKLHQSPHSAARTVQWWPASWGCYPAQRLNGRRPSSGCCQLTADKAGRDKSTRSSQLLQEPRGSVTGVLCIFCWVSDMTVEAASVETIRAHQRYSATAASVLPSASLELASIQELDASCPSPSRWTG